LRDSLALRDVDLRGFWERLGNGWHQIEIRAEPKLREAAHPVVVDAVRLPSHPRLDVQVRWTLEAESLEDADRARVRIGGEVLVS
jgi:hypothetical protein